MKNDRKITLSCFLSVLIVMAVLCGSAYANSSEPAGHAIFVHDAVWRMTMDEAKLPLRKGDSVYETDTIMTGKKGSAQLVMSDGAYISIRPDTSIRLDVYHYDKEEEEGLGESVITLLKGCFRSITGLIGKENKENYRIKTPVASIGIRGTDHEPLYIPEPEEGEIPIGEPGLYDKVNAGETYIENEAGVVTVLPNQVGYAADQTTLATVEDTIPDVYNQFSTTDSDSEEDLLADATSQDDPKDLKGIPNPTPIPPEEPQVTARPVQYYGIFTWPSAASDKGIIGFGADETELITDENGNLTGYNLAALGNPTAPTRGESGHYSETTIEYGTWQADSIDNYPVGNGLVHWIKGSISDVNYLSQVITGTQTYTFDGGTAPTNQDGIAGTLNSASLSVDFSRQALDVALQLNVNSHDWSAIATDVPIDRGLFTASIPLLEVYRDGDNTNTWGNLSGTFAGEGLSGVLLGYTLGDTSVSETVNGTASFYAMAQDKNAPYREIGIAGTDVRAPMPTTLALSALTATSAVSTDGSGHLTGFDTMLPQYSSTTTGFVDAQSPVHLDINAATLTDTGTDEASGITWGRWSGTITATDRVSGTTASPSFDPQELHFIAGPEMTSSVALPIMGTKTYQFAGGTHPTDNLGNIGTLNSASLTADFTNMTVKTGIDATVGTTNFIATSTATPIESGHYFNATTNDSLSLSCNVGTTQTGVISGSFYGAHGESAGLAYSFNTTGVEINQTISGTAAFK